MAEYEKRAREAEAAAGRARTPEERRAFREIAALWRKRLGDARGGGDGPDGAGTAADSQHGASTSRSP